MGAEVEKYLELKEEANKMLSQFLIDKEQVLEEKLIMEKELEAARTGTNLPTVDELKLLEDVEDSFALKYPTALEDLQRKIAIWQECIQKFNDKLGIEYEEVKQSHNESDIENEFDYDGTFLNNYDVI